MHRSLKACIQPGRDMKDREKLLQQKLAELSTHLQRLERCMAMLRAENDVLRQKQTDQRSLEEKVRLLRKRNSDLATSSRRLEDRVRSLQERTSRNGQKTKTENQRSEFNSRRLNQTGQPANHNMTYTRTSDDRHRDIDNLHRKCRKLTDLLNSTNASTRQNTSQFEEKEEEFIHIIKIAAKERLQLEHELAHNRVNQGLHHPEAGTGCLALSAGLSHGRHSPQCQQMLTRVQAEKQQLQHTISCLWERQDKITEECNTLKLSLASAQKEKEDAETEAKYLSRRVHSLENVVRDLQESAEHVTQLESQTKTAMQQLKQKQTQLEHLQQMTSTIDTKHTEKLSTLNQLLADSEERRRLEEESRLKLIQEVQRLQKEAVEREKVVVELQVKQTLAQRNHEISSQPGEDKNKNRETAQEVSRKSWNQNEQHSNDSLMSLWARNGPIQVYVVKYNYDPFQLSPNENPEAELPLAAGDYVLVVGDMDEDGFFDGELIDGSQGLVPSNFIEKVKDEDLSHFHEVLLHAGQWIHSRTDNKLTNNQKTMHTPEKSAPVTAADINNSSSHLHFASEHRRCSNTNTETPDNTDYRYPKEVRDDVEDVNGNSHNVSGSTSPSVHGEMLTHSFLAAPCPRKLSLKQLADSVHISWTGPDPSPGLQVYCYHVLVDGQTKAIVGSNERTKVALEGISASDTCCRVCVRCLSNRGQSSDAQCTMVVGKDTCSVPTDLAVPYISPTTTVLTWLPGNSNYHHSVSVSGQEVAVIRPGIFYHIFSGLEPGKLYKVTVTSKSPSGVLEDVTSESCLQHAGASTEFSTPVAGQALGTESMVQSPASVKEVEEDQAAISARQTGFQPLDSVDGEEQKGLETDEEIEEAFRQVEYLNEGTDVLNESSYSDSSRTELSDIPEVEEDLLGSQDSQLNQAGKSQAVTKSPEWTTDKSVLLETDDHPREFHAEKPAQFAGKPLIAPTPLTPTTVTQNHVTKQVALPEVEEENFPSTHSTPTNMYAEQPTNSNNEQPTLDSHVSRAFHIVDQTRQKNIVNSVHVISVRGKDDQECMDSKIHIHNSQPACNNPARLLSDSSRLDLVKEAPRNQLVDSETLEKGLLSVAQHGNHVVRLSVSSITPSENSGTVSGNVSPVVKANSVRLFIALFDYYPATMSPNVDSVDEELPFREGQILKVFGHKDADGFYKGESNGRMGYIPCNMVCEVQIDDPKLRQQLLQDIAEIPGEAHTVPCQESSDSPVITNGMTCVPTKNSLGRKMVALYDYNPQELSPNMDTELELPFKTGDIVTIYGDIDEDGFFTGEINNKHGLVPSNFLQPVPSSNYRHST